MTRLIELTPGEAKQARNKTCSVCAAACGAWLQHANQDTGWGLCRYCADWIPARGVYLVEEVADLYGLPGRNYEGKLHRVHGRMFVVVAEFPEAEVDRANAFMAKHAGVSVLEVLSGRVILAWSADSGIEL